MLDSAALGGLVDVVWRGVCELQQQHAPTGAALNSRFKTEATAPYPHVYISAYISAYLGAAIEWVRPPACDAQRIETPTVSGRHQYIAVHSLIRTLCLPRRSMT